MAASGSGGHKKLNSMLTVGNQIIGSTLNTSSRLGSKDTDLYKNKLQLQEQNQLLLQQFQQLVSQKSLG